MAQKATSSDRVIQAMRAWALAYPGASEGVACAGTALEKRTIKAGSKAFLFLGLADAMLKLGESGAEVAKLAKAEPGRYKAGAHGWVTIALGGEPPPVERLMRWIDESYRLLAGKQLLAKLPVAAARRSPSKRSPARDRRR